MFISKFRLFNYKSFFDSGLLEFSPEINIIVGQNNSGKTALLKALSLNFDHEPHRSFKTLPSNSSRIDSKTSFEISLTCTKDEFQALIDQLPHHSVGIYQPDDNTITPDEMVRLFQEWLDNPEPVEIIACLSQRESSDKRSLLIRDLNSKIILYHQIEDSSRRRLLNPKCKVISIAREDNGLLLFNKDNFFQSFEDLLSIIYKRFQSKIYRFRAERLSLGSCSFGSSFELDPNASNLAEVINILQGRGQKKIFEQFNQYVSIIFPEIKSISVRPKPKQPGVISVPNSSHLEILVWSIEAAENDREDLAFPLAECGTGIGQVLAILYVVLTSQEARTIIIDEPQSFLHPGAAKKLVDILKEFPQHQYFIATHSPMIIAAANPSTIVKLRHEDGGTKASMMNSEDVNEQRSLLAELGVRLSDIFGADSILWVEGPTEERCFPLILEKVAKKPLRGTQVLAVKNTGDLEGKRAHLIFDIYDKLSGGKSLFPPAVSFLLDREDRSEQDIEDFKRRTQNPIEFLPRRMYENYLLHPKAIAALINKEDKCREESLTTKEIQEWLDKKQQEGLYLPKSVCKQELSDPGWLCRVDGASLLKRLFIEYSESRVEFSKTKHSFKLTEWLVENEPDHLYELGNFLKEALNKLPKVSDS